MHAFCGIMMKRGVRPDMKLLNSMVSSFNPHLPVGRVEHNRLIMAVMDERQRTTVAGALPLYENAQHLLVYNGRFDMEIGQQGRGQDDGQAILEYIYQSPEKLRGDYAVAAYDKKLEQLLLLRDPLGTRPLYYLEQPDYVAFATEMKALKALPGVEIAMDETWIADALSTVQSEKWRTPYTAIRRVQPGHRLVVGRTVDEERYWDLKVSDGYSGIGYEEAVALFSEKLQRAVSCRIGDDAVVGTELSGGLDSSGVTAMAVQLVKESGRSLFALTHAFSDQSLGQYFPYRDEREFSLAVSEHIGLKTQVFCDADGYGLLEMLKQNILVQSGPTQQGYSMFSDTLYDRGRDRGVTTLLSGFGGDEGVTSKAGGFFEEMAVKGRWDLYRKEFMERSGAKGVRK
ncbi:MAG: hypothetical protein K9G38_06675, partial [Bacteroidales bacterium]|nr:hypothetical protein [Bacteroidales bacterium]